MADDDDDLLHALVEFGGELRCSICRNLFSNPVTLPCTHCYCHDCVERLFESSPKERPCLIQCPICRCEVADRKYVLPAPHIQQIVQSFSLARDAVQLLLGANTTALFESQLSSPITAASVTSSTPANPSSGNAKTPPTIRLAPLITPSSAEQAEERKPKPSATSKVFSLRSRTRESLGTEEQETRPKKDPYRLNATVTVARRKMPGVNKPGGVGKIVARHEDGTFDIHYTVEGTREKNVELCYITPGMNLASDSLFGSGNGNKQNASSSPASNGSNHENIIATETPIRKKAKTTLVVEPPPLPRILFSTLPAATQKRALGKTIKALGGCILEDDDWAEMTHLVTGTTRSVEEEQVLLAARRSGKYIKAIAMGNVIIVGPEWLQQCEREKRWVDTKEFQVMGDNCSHEAGLPLGGPQRSRAEFPKRELFAGMLFALLSPKARGLDLAELVKTCGGKVCASEFGTKTAAAAGLLAQAKRESLEPVIIEGDYDEDKVRELDGGELLHKHVKPLKWLLESICCYTLLPSM